MGTKAMQNAPKYHNEHPLFSRQNELTLARRKEIDSIE